MHPHLLAARPHHWQTYEDAIQQAEKLLLPCNGSAVRFIDFYNQYQGQLGYRTLLSWLADNGYLIGHYNNHQNWIANVRFSTTKRVAGTPLILKGGRLKNEN